MIYNIDIIAAAKKVSFGGVEVRFIEKDPLLPDMVDVEMVDVSSVVMMDWEPDEDVEMVDVSSVVMIDWEPDKDVEMEDVQCMKNVTFVITV